MAGEISREDPTISRDTTLTETETAAAADADAPRPAASMPVVSESHDDDPQSVRARRQERIPAVPATFTETETVVVAASTDAALPDVLMPDVSESQRERSTRRRDRIREDPPEYIDAQRERESFARRRERCLDGLGKFICSMLEWLVWLIGMLIVAITMLQLLPFAIVLIIIGLVVNCRRAINRAVARRVARRFAAATSSENTWRAQLHGQQLMIRQCLAVESCNSSDPIVSMVWGDNALENHTSSEAVYWPVSQADDCSVCYLFSARLRNVSASDMAAPEIDIELAVHIPKHNSNTKLDIETVANPTKEHVYDPTNDGAGPSQPRDATATTASQQGKQDDIPHTKPTATAACDICLADFQVGSYVAWSNNAKCRHAFHVHCILEWLRQQPTCPTCRQDYLL